MHSEHIGLPELQLKNVKKIHVIDCTFKCRDMEIPYWLTPYHELAVQYHGHPHTYMWDSFPLMVHTRPCADLPIGCSIFNYLLMYYCKIISR